MGFYHPTPFEVATGYVHGLLPANSPPDVPADPVAALDAAMLVGLQNGPCYVTFSGGRDSSTVLAAATRLARRNGLPDPVPVTEVYPEVPATDEFAWQRMIIDHLGLTDWVRVEVRDENDLVGPAAAASLQQRGLLWPPAVHIKTSVLSKLGGGSVLTGEGGDEILGAHRATPVVRLARQWRQAGLLRGLALSARACAPRQLRAQLLRRQVASSGSHPWLLPDPWRCHVETAADTLSTEPFHWGRSVWWVLRGRAGALAAANHAAIAAEYGILLIDPLLDRRFVAAVAAAGGRWGYAGRAEFLERFFGDILPPQLIQRFSKASFNDAYASHATKSFAQMWDGSGVDPEFVDVDRLKQEWLSDYPSALSFMLLQQAWLATHTQSTPGVAR